MAGPLLLKQIPLLLVLLLITNDVHADNRVSRQEIDRCRSDLARCYRLLLIPCLGTGYNVYCYGPRQRCNGVYDCLWGEDEINCGFPMLPVATSLVTRTVFRSTTSTSISTRTTTSTSSTSTTSTFTSTVLTTSTTSTASNTTAFVRLTPSRVFSIGTLLTGLNTITSAVLIPRGQILNGGSTCQRFGAPNGFMAGPNDYIVTPVTVTASVELTLSASCSATTTTIFP